MNTAHEQTTLWNGPAGRAWVEAQDVLDGIFKPLEMLLVEAVIAESGTHVLDVGCGTGGTTLAVAQLSGAPHYCTGIDISAPMIATARTRAERENIPASFIQADAQIHPFPPASFDTIISRFGVMFFDDCVQAFANLRRAARDDAGLCFVAWQSPEDNPFMTTAERAAAALVPAIPPRQSDAPGQFAFADRDRVHRILDDSGWRNIDIEPIDVACTFPETALVHYFSRLGPLGRILPEVDTRTRHRVIKTVRAAFEPYVYGAEVRFNAACWLVRARSSAPAAAPAEVADV